MGLKLLTEILFWRLNMIIHVIVYGLSFQLNCLLFGNKDYVTIG